MLRESVQSWPQDPWPLLDNTANLDTNTNSFDSASFLNADHVLQLQDLFGQDQLDFDGDTSLLYDEFTYVPESNNVNAIEPSDLTHHYMETNTKRRRSSSSCSSSSNSSSSGSSSGSSSEGEEDTHDFSSMTRDVSDSSDDEQVNTPSPYLHRRQMEELILDKITNHLDAEKLPGILTIISKSQPAEEEEEVEEVEIDLAKLDRDQLVRILSYVDACLTEKKGGAKVILSDYTIQKPVSLLPPPPASVSVSSPSKQTRRRHRNRRRSSIVEAGHVVNGSSGHARLSATHGPISMSALTDFEKSASTGSAAASVAGKKKAVRKRRGKKTNKDEDVSVHMASMDVSLFGDSIASTKPKRRTAIHKRRLLEEMLQPSNNESSSEEEEDDDGIIVFGDEQMDLAVTQNETIVHQESLILEPVIIEEPTEEEEDDELIDIMM
ncbi:hypothetical protein INT47_005101 [Mucor saturninus]|uniref:NET domain-containing protein n=1 Tax=Mucor saturninus TaxID=64648 RepID=A0A8H7QUR4_9FUNG|nr:hypothetical protein INT47_005101 [Mucor saturninus]